MYSDLLRLTGIMVLIVYICGMLTLRILKKNQESMNKEVYTNLNLLSSTTVIVVSIFGMLVLYKVLTNL